MGKTEAEVAIDFGVSQQTIKNWLALGDLSAPVRKAIEAGQIAASAGAQLTSLSREDQVARLEELKASGGKVTAERTRRAVSKGDTKKRLRMRSKQEITDRLEAGKDSKDFLAALKWVLNQGKKR